MLQNKQNTEKRKIGRSMRMKCLLHSSGTCSLYFQYTCNKVAKAVKQCSIHFLSVEL